jgi:hypothetical protein
MTRIKQSAKTLLILSVLLIFNGCTSLRTPLGMDMPELYYVNGKCSEIPNSWEYSKCASEQIEALKYDRSILLEITKRCVK